MKNFLGSESTIYTNFVNVITDRFVKLRYGIKNCSREVCDELAEIRFELLKWCKPSEDGTCSSSTNPPSSTIKVEWGYGAINPFGVETTLTFQFNTLIQSGYTTLNLDFSYPSSGNYLYFRIPTGGPIFFNWYNNITNYGPIPDIIWRTKETIGEYDYYVSRDLYYTNLGSTTLTFS